MKISRIIKNSHRFLSVYKSLPIQAENNPNLQIYRTTIHCGPIPADANPDGKEGCLIASKIIKESEKHILICLLHTSFVYSMSYIIGCR
jgi:hypothetical protein